MSELLWLLVNDCDFNAAMKTPLETRTPNIECVYEKDNLFYNGFLI